MVYMGLDTRCGALGGDILGRTRAPHRLSTNIRTFQSNTSAEDFDFTILFSGKLEAGVAGCRCFLPRPRARVSERTANLGERREGYMTVDVISLAVTRIGSRPELRRPSQAISFTVLAPVRRFHGGEKPPATPPHRTLMSIN